MVQCQETHELGIDSAEADRVLEIAAQWAVADQDHAKFYLLGVKYLGCLDQIFDAFLLDEASDENNHTLSILVVRPEIVQVDAVAMQDHSVLRITLLEQLLANEAGHGDERIYPGDHRISAPQQLPASPALLRGPFADGRVLAVESNNQRDGKPRRQG